MDYLAVFRALSNPYRLKILFLLSEKPCTITDLSKTLRVSPPLVSIHLRKLLRAGLVKEGKRETIDRTPGPPLNRLYYEITNFNIQVNQETLRKEVNL